MFSLPEFIQRAQSAAVLSQQTGRPMSDVIRDMAKDEQDKRNKEMAAVREAYNAEVAELVAQMKNINTIL